jgi:hypothetical protein
LKRGFRKLASSIFASQAPGIPLCGVSVCER